MDGIDAAAARHVSRAHRRGVSSRVRAPDRFVTHGCDNGMYAWKVPSAAYGLSTTLAVDAAPNEIPARKQPWLVAGIEINALNFCGLGFFDGLAAVPSVLEASAVDVFLLADGRRIHTRVASGETTGMAMALELLQSRADELELELVGVQVRACCRHAQPWGEALGDRTYLQPALAAVLSPALYPNGKAFWTTAADSLILRHPLRADGKVKVVDTRHLARAAGCERTQ